jgi:hypothetical protein
MNIERRKNLRIYDPLPVFVYGSRVKNQTFQFDTISWDFGPGGLCAFAPYILRENEKISLRIRLARSGGNPLQAPEVVARATILRSQAIPDGSCLFAASFVLRQVV